MVVVIIGSVVVHEEGPLPLCRIRVKHFPTKKMQVPVEYRSLSRSAEHRPLVAGCRVPGVH